MRISDCAELTGTTVRTIRYYHQIGLLPAPSGHGQRDYGLDEVARILRIRWLAEAGLSLDAIADLLAEEAEDSEPARLRDLRSSAETIDARIAELQQQRRRITHLITLAEQGRPLTAMPPSLAAFYDRVESVATDPRARAVLNRERRLAEIMSQRGLVPARAEALLDRFSDEDIAWISGLYIRYFQLSTLPAEAADAEADALVAEIDRWCREHTDIAVGFLNLLPAWAWRPRALASLIDLSTLVFTGRRENEFLQRAVHNLIQLSNELSTEKGPA